MAGGHHEEAAGAVSGVGVYVERDAVVAGDEHAFAFLHVDLFLAVVKGHPAGIHVVDGIFARAVGATARIVIEEAEKNIVVVEDGLHRLVLFGCHDGYGSMGKTCSVAFYRIRS